MTKPTTYPTTTRSLHRRKMPMSNLRSIPSLTITAFFVYNLAKKDIFIVVCPYPQPAVPSPFRQEKIYSAASLTYLENLKITKDRLVMSSGCPSIPKIPKFQQSKPHRKLSKPVSKYLIFSLLFSKAAKSASLAAPV